MLGRLWLLMRGQVRVRITGASLERFLNLCAQQDITLRQMRRTAWNEMQATLSVADFRELRRHMGRTGCRVHILRRRGAPFLAAALRPRYALWGGFLALVWLCWVMTAHIWAIETEISPSAKVEMDALPIGRPSAEAICIASAGCELPDRILMFLP